MTHTRTMQDSDGTFETWRDHPDPCNRMVETGERQYRNVDGAKVDDGPERKPCGAKVEVRCWESSDGAYEDYQYRCANGHTWWIDGIDS